MTCDVCNADVYELEMWPGAELHSSTGHISVHFGAVDMGDISREVVLCKACLLVASEILNQELKEQVAYGKTLGNSTEASALEKKSP